MGGGADARRARTFGAIDAARPSSHDGADGRRAADVPTATSRSSSSAREFDEAIATATRRVTLERESDGKWRVVGYVMR